MELFWNKTERMVVNPSFQSTHLDAAEKNYAAHDLELLAIVETFRARRCYLHGRKFIIITDHYWLRFIETQDYLSPRQLRWLERLVEFYFTIIHAKEKSPMNFLGSQKTVSSHTITGRSCEKQHQIM